MLPGPLLGIPPPLLPAQILWINLLTHGVARVALGAEPVAPDAMRHAPHGVALLHAGFTDLCLRYVKAGLQPLLLSGAILIATSLATVPPAESVLGAGLAIVGFVSGLGHVVMCLQARLKPERPPRGGPPQARERPARHAHGRRGFHTGL